MKILTYFLIALLFLIAGCSSDTPQVENSERKTAIAGYEVQPRDLSRIVRVSSLIEPENTVTVAARMDGLITSMNVREGDRIKSGEILAQLDVEEFEAQLTRARAERDLVNARYERFKRLIETEAISRAEYEEAAANLDIAKSEVQLLETRIRFGTIRAPFDLVILRRHVEQGDAVSSSDPLFRVADINRLVIRAGIPERDVVFLNEDQQVQLDIDAYPDETFTGTIQRIYPAADEDSRLFTVEIRVRAEQQDVRLRPGFLARITLHADRRENVIAVPSESLLASDRDERFVYVINNEDRLVRRDVVTGIERRNWTQILDGLESGEVVVGANPSNLREDLLIQVSRWVENSADNTSRR